MSQLAHRGTPSGTADRHMGLSGSHRAQSPGQGTGRQIGKVGKEEEEGRKKQLPVKPAWAHHLP